MGIQSIKAALQLSAEMDITLKLTSEQSRELLDYINQLEENNFVLSKALDDVIEERDEIIQKFT